jgi:prepilin-type processing-associated H-X9-DG protein
MLFETDLSNRNYAISAGKEYFTPVARHGQGSHVCFVDGTSAAIVPEDKHNLIWDVEESSKVIQPI